MVIPFSLHPQRGDFPDPKTLSFVFIFPPLGTAVIIDLNLFSVIYYCHLFFYYLIFSPFPPHFRSSFIFVLYIFITLSVMSILCIFLLIAVLLSLKFSHILPNYLYFSLVVFVFYPAIFPFPLFLVYDFLLLFYRGHDFFYLSGEII